MKTKSALVFAGIAVAAMFSNVRAQSDNYPAKPVTIIAPSGPGGGFDYVGRLMAAGLSKQFGTTFVLENRTGSGTVVGTQAVVNAAPDGYTLMVGGISNLVFNAALYHPLSYDPREDFVVLGLVARYPYVMVARQDLPVRDYAELIAAARAHPGKMTIATAGVGSGQQVLAEAFMKTSGTSMMPVPYKSAQAAYQDLIAGRVDVFIDSLPTVRPYVESKRMRALFLTGPVRSKLLPDVPTVAEIGLPTLETGSWFGLAAPRKTPAPIVDKLRKAMAVFVKNPDLKTTLESGGIELMDMDQATTDALVKSEYDKWTRVIKDAGIRAD
jgi:tripartite-type tricarboxylate transporter receptor subunit TctC